MTVSSKRIMNSSNYRNITFKEATVLLLYKKTKKNFSLYMKISDIENTVNFMDTTYDANFGEWIRNEENARIVAHNLKKYVCKYPNEEFITVLKYIVRDWTLRSIIILIKKIFDKKFLDNTEILQGLVYTWNSVFIAEFLMSIMKNLEIQDKIKFLRDFFIVFEYEKVYEIMAHMDGKIESKVKEAMISQERKRNKGNRKGILSSFYIP
ncbi:hypothetical protein GVAV_002167 [Gurleya vavrai]